MVYRSELTTFVQNNVKMEITGKIIVALPEVGGTSRAGNAWKKNEYVIETFDAYPKKVAITVFGNKTENVHMEAGKAYTVSVDLGGRGFIDRRNTNVHCYAAREVDAPVGAGSQPQAVSRPADPFNQPAASKPFGGATAASAGTAFDNEGSDDLPF